MIFDYNRTIYNPDKDQLTDGAQDVLELLREKGVTMFLIAKGNAERRKRIESLGLPQFFQRIIVNPNKSPDDYRSCKEECLPDTEVFAVGDRVQEEIRHAIACGIKTIWFRNGKFSNEFPSNVTEQPLHTVVSLREILDIILPMKDLEDYYRKRAQEYEEIYRRPDPVRQQEQKEMGAALRAALAGKSVLEVACGTGYWTQVASETAAHITAVDAAPEVLAIAKAKTWPLQNVNFRIGDAYDVQHIPGSFNAGLAMFWFSHIPKARLAAFLQGFHVALGKDAHVFIGDNMFVEGIGGPLLHKPGLEDTFKVRTLSDGSSHEILKNYYSREELHSILSPFASDLSLEQRSCFWWAHYRVQRSLQ